MYNLILVDVCRDKTCLHRMNVITGDYLSPKYVKGSILEQIKGLIMLLELERPDKIIFDKNGYGYVFYQYFMEMIALHRYIHVDNFGLILYKKEDSQ